MALLMLYDRLTYNPYDDISEEITEIQTELRQLAVDSQEIKQDFENINSNVARR
jgi:CHASE3 domain sensor protein